MFAAIDWFALFWFGGFFIAFAAWHVFLAVARPGIFQNLMQQKHEAAMLKAQQRHQTKNMFGRLFRFWLMKR